MFNKVTASILTLLFSLNLSASKISTDRVIITFEKNASIAENIQVNNLYNGSTFVKVELYEVLNANTEKEKRILYMQNDKSTKEGEILYEQNKSIGIEIKSPQESDLFFSPSRIVLESSESNFPYEKIRVINMNKNLEKERVYRIRVEPVINGFSIKSEKTIGIKILTAYETLIFVQPDKIKKDIKVKFDGGKVLFKNNGNINSYFSKMESCDKDDICNIEQGFRLYSYGEKELVVGNNVKYIQYTEITGKYREKIKVER
jgi:hypothetical protein